jgi:hypothetical protein
LAQEFMFDTIHNCGVLGTSDGYVNTIEFLKRGLPHAHILLWHHQDDKPRTTDDYDSFVSIKLYL